MLTGEDGVAFLEQTRLKPDVPTDSVHAAVQALQFVWTYESGLIPQPRLQSSMRRLLSNNDLRILTITNLSRWKDWDSWPELERLFRNECADDRALKKPSCCSRRNAKKQPQPVAFRWSSRMRRQYFWRRPKWNIPSCFVRPIMRNFLGRDLPQIYFPGAGAC